MYKVTVKVGEREFSGEGLTAQAARHDAAAKALDQLRNLPLEPSMVEAIVASKFFLKKYPVFNCLQSELIPIGLAFSLEVPYGGPSTVFSLRCICGAGFAQKARKALASYSFVCAFYVVILILVSCTVLLHLGNHSKYVNLPNPFIFLL